MDNDGKTLVESKYANTANVEQYEIFILPTMGRSCG